jgi:hypothetical protein
MSQKKFIVKASADFPDDPRIGQKVYLSEENVFEHTRKLKGIEKKIHRVITKEGDVTLYFEDQLEEVVE